MSAVLVCGCPLGVVQDEGHQEGCAARDWLEANGGEVHVQYTVPVTAVVNLTTGVVSQVVVGDEQLVLSVNGDGVPEVLLATTSMPVREYDARMLAVDIADSPDVEWPRWEYGW